MALTTTRPCTTSPPGHWESTGRITLALCSLVLGTALASTWSLQAAIAAVQVLAVLGAAVVYPDVARRVHRRAPAVAWPVALAVVAVVLGSALWHGSAVTVLAYIGGLAVLSLAVSPLLHVGPRRLR